MACNVKAKKKRADGAFKRAVLAKTAALSTEELEALRNDLSDQVAVRGEEAVKAVVPEGALQRKLQEVAAGTPMQKGEAIRKAVSNAALYGSGGALALGVAQGPQGIPQGIIRGAVPAAFSGYFGAKKDQQQREIEGILREHNVDNSPITP